jgi:hypothetical protein
MLGRGREFVPARSLTTSKLTPDQPINRRTGRLRVLPAPGVTDALHSRTKSSRGKKSAGAATKGAGSRYLRRKGNNNSGGL